MAKLNLTKDKAAMIYSACTILGEKDLPIWWTIVRNLQELEEPMKAYDKAKQAIIDKLADKDENGKPVIVGGRMIEFGEKKDEAEKCFKDLADEILELSLKTIDIKKVKDYVLAANVVRPLVGTVFTGSLDEEEEPKLETATA